MAYNTFKNSSQSNKKTDPGNSHSAYWSKALFPFLFFILLISLHLSASARDMASHKALGPLNPPEINIHTVTALPGEVLVQVDALNFTGTNGQVGAITLRIAVDTLLISFIDIQNYTLAGTWIANYNQAQHEITIVYTAFMGTGFDLNGKLLDLRLNYLGGFTADLSFKPNCEVSTKNLMLIENIVYGNGSVIQGATAGSVVLHSTAAHPAQVFPVPVSMGGNGYTGVTAIKLLIAFDSTKMVYQGYESLVLAGAVVSVNKNQIRLQWTDEANPVNFVAAANLLNLRFAWLGQGNTEIQFSPGSYVKNAVSVIPTGFINGTVSEMYQVVTSASPVQGGSTSGDGYYMQDSLVSVSATANPNYSFAHWSVGSTIVSYDAQYEFAMPASNLMVAADFVATTYLLSLQVDPAGAGSASGGGNYSPGQAVTVSTISNSGYTFINWTLNGAIISNVPSFQFTMPSGNITLRANYGLTTYALDLIASPQQGGTVSGGGYYAQGEAVTVSAMANQGYIFENWTLNGAVVSNNPDFVFSMPGNSVSLFAHFQLIAFELMLESSPPGSGLLSGSGLYNAGEQIMVNAVALPGYEFVNWTLNSTVVSILPGFVYTMSAASSTLVAHFIMTGHKLTLQASPAGAGLLSGTGIYNQGEVVSVSAMAATGYSFINWTRDGNVVSTQAVFNYTMPAVNITLQANFELSGYELTLEVSPPDAGQLSGAGLYNAGQTATLTASANPGYSFINWTSGGTVVSTLQSFEYTMPDSPVTLTAHFEYIRFQLSLSVNPAGAAQVSGAGAYDGGDQVTVSALANPGYFFLNWTIEGAIVSNQASFTYTMPSANVLMVANFVAIDYQVVLSVEPENSGTVSGSGFYNAGETVVIHAVPGPLNHFLNWKLNGTVVSILPDYSFTMPDHDLSLTANFSVKLFTVSVMPDNPVYGTVSGQGSYPRGATATVTANALPGYRFILWTENDHILSAENPLSFIVDTNRQLIAYFRKDEVCTAPIAIEALEIGKTSAQLHWYPSGDESAWKILWGLRNFDTVNSGSLINDVTANSYFLENLNPETAYDFYVKAVCNSSQQSHWEGPTAFSTKPVSTPDFQKEQTFKIFPNPAREFITIKFAEGVQNANRLRVLDHKGATVISRNETICDNYCVRLEALKPGIYMLQLVFANWVTNATFIVY
jgi:hypothetical protein